MAQVLGVLNFNISETAKDLFFLLRYIFIILNFVLIAVHIFLLSKALKFRPVFHPKLADLVIKEKEKVLEVERYAKEWEEIKKNAFNNPPDSFKMAIIAADSFIDKILIDLGFSGEHMADRLEELSLLDLRSINNLWKAHRIRNEIAHSTSFVLSEEETTELLDTYEKFLEEIGIVIKEKNE